MNDRVRFLCLCKSEDKGTLCWSLGVKVPAGVQGDKCLLRTHPAELHSVLLWWVRNPLSHLPTKDSPSPQHSWPANHLSLTDVISPHYDNAQGSPLALNLLLIHTGSEISPRKRNFSFSLLDHTLLSVIYEISRSHLMTVV